MTRWTPLAIIATIAILAITAHANAVPQAAHADVSYGRDVKPILARHCYACHGPDASTREAQLNLDDRDSTLQVLNLDRPAQSRLLRRITAHDADVRMPPPPADGLTPAQIAVLTAWIRAGAPYEEHWSWQPLEDPDVPDVDDTSWPRDDIDRFILSRLEANDITPARDADRRTLIRRASFDLRGLPPTIEEVDAFVADERPDDEAFAAVVDAYLADPAFGEHWGQHWLDLMRYAETHGHEYDYPIKYAHEYRDYVIRAINADVPFDDYLREHIAGDMLAAPRRHPDELFDESVIATGFWFLGQATHAPVDLRADEAERIDNQIDVMSKTFLGVTVSCARCHDHKFDAVSAEDYYALSGFLQSSRRDEAFLDPHGRIAELASTLNFTNLALAEACGTSMQQWQRRHDSDTLARVIEAAIEVRTGSPRPEDEPIAPSFIVFDDFEDGHLDHWTLEGTAFAPTPRTQETIGAYQGDVKASGRGFINTHRVDGGEDVRQADEHLGRMTSRPFTIVHDWIHFRIGGGNHPGKTCINLLIDGKIVRTATGHNSNVMRKEWFNVSEFDGKPAQVEIVDDVSGGWGQIAIDAIVFSDDLQLVPTPSRPAERVADEFDLDPRDVTLWSHALGRLAVSDDELNPNDPGALHTALEHLCGEPALSDDTTVLESFDDDWRQRWFLSGHAFGDPHGARVDDDQRVSIEPWTVADSATTHPALQGIARSQTFELTEPFLSYRARGKGTFIRLILDGYTLDEFNALLYEEMRQPIDTPVNAIGDGWTTIVVDVTRFVGHRAYVELVDEGLGWLQVDEIRSHPNRPNPIDPTHEVIDPTTTLATQLHAAIDQWNDRTLTPHHARLLNWAIAESLGPTFNGDAITAARMQHMELGPTIPAPRRVLAIQDGTPENEYVFVRGSHKSPGPIVDRRFIESLGGTSNEIDRRTSGRLQLADSMLGDENPLTARVAANRVWHHLTGRGLVQTTDDFGALGEPPTHPELLDHLAHWYRTDGAWSRKALIRRIMLTSAYRMASHGSSGDILRVDPTNRLLHSARIRRLTAEPIRDAVLAVSGQLDRTMHGRPVPIHLTEFMTGRGRPRESGPMDGHGRRSIYLGVHRNFVNPMLTAFDKPIPSTTVGNRNASNVPAQALTMMNDPFVHEQAEHWAARLLAMDLHSDKSRIERMYAEALSRAPHEDEIRLARQFLDEQLDAHLERGHERPHAAAWTDLCHVLFNTKEFIFLR